MVAQQCFDFSQITKKPNVGFFLDVIVAGAQLEASNLRIRTGYILPPTLQELARKEIEKTLPGQAYLEEMKTEFPQTNNN